MPEDLAPHLERIRQQGYEERDSYQVQGVVNISLPVFDNHGEAIAALTVPFLPRIDNPTPDAVVIEALRKAARMLSASMGHIAQAEHAERTATARKTKAAV